MSAFIQHFNYEFRTGLRNKNLLLMNYLFPLGFYLMMGFIMPEINPSFRNALIPALVVFAILASTLLGLPDPLVNARETGIFRSYKINGVPALSILVIPALTTVLHLGIVTAVITLTAPVLFDAAAPTNWLNYDLVALALALACTGLGVLIGVVSPSTRMTVLFSQVIFVPSMLLGGMMMPLEMLPEVAQRAGLLLPATYGMVAFNGLAMGETAVFAPWAAVAILAGSGLLSFGLALYLFSWDNRNAARRGHPLLALLALLPLVVGIFWL
ncbi:MAG: ABC transporter permease [Anaerolineales bacterium]|nr:ABC transporter permease [Anaerolineales bacterium]